MKTYINIFLLGILFIPGPALSLFNLLGTKRHVIIQLRREHGAVLLNNKKVRVPYTMQETAIPAKTDGLTEFLFLDNYQVCVVTAFIQLIIGLGLIFIYYLNMVESRLREYRITALRCLFWSLPALVVSEVISHHVVNSWIIDVKNGINGKWDLFGVNATFPNGNDPIINLDYQPNIGLFILPLIALAVLRINMKRKEEQLT